MRTQGKSKLGSRVRSNTKPATVRMKSVKLTVEQQEKLAAVREIYAKRQKEWDALTPEQQREEHEGWKRAMNRMNDDRRNSGERLLFVNEIE